jgi:hypothetical protein
MPWVTELTKLTEDLDFVDIMCTLDYY